nr:hemolysin family protein [Micromonospora sp. DSM 115978]
LKRLSFLLSGAQLGITITSLVVGFIAEPAIADLISPVLDATGLPESASTAISIGLALLLATVLQMVFGELVPKNWAIARPMPVARWVTPPHRAFSSTFSWLITFLNNSANWIVRRLGVEPAEELRSARSPDELRFMVASSADHGTLESRTASLLVRGLSFGDRRAADVMTPRSQAVGLPADATVDDMLDVVRSTGHSRFPVYGSDLDDVVGVVHIKQAFDVPRDQRATTKVTEFSVPAVRVPATLDCDRLLVILRRRGLQLAVVIDEYGGTDGIVTLEDLVEEIVGEVADEHDPEAPELATHADDGSWDVSGLLRVDEVADRTGFRAPDGPYDTVAGLVLDRLGHLPDVGESVEVEGWTLSVVAMDGHRIDRLRLVRPAASARLAASARPAAVVAGSASARPNGEHDEVHCHREARVRGAVSRH